MSSSPYTPIPIAINVGVSKQHGLTSWAAGTNLFNVRHTTAKHHMTSHRIPSHRIASHRITSLKHHITAYHIITSHHHIARRMISPHRNTAPDTDEAHARSHVCGHERGVSGDRMCMREGMHRIHVCTWIGQLDMCMDCMLSSSIPMLMFARVCRPSSVSVSSHSQQHFRREDYM